MLVTILRIEQGKDGTVGILSIDGETQCYTLELPWMDNKRNISSIPAGNYVCKRYSSNAHPDTFEITDVYNRSYILFHVANTIDDLQGCVGLGTEIGYLIGKRAVLNSTKAFNSFIDATSGRDKFNLLVLN